MERLKVLYYDSFTTHDSIGVKTEAVSGSGHSMVTSKEEEIGNVRPAEHQEIFGKLLKQCTNGRDQLLIMLLAETGYRNRRDF